MWTRTGFRIRELLLTVDFHESTCFEWADTMLIFPKDLPELVIGSSSSFESTTRKARSVNAIPGAKSPHPTSTSRDIATCAWSPCSDMRYETRRRVSGTIDGVVRAAAANDDHTMRWRKPEQPFIHRRGSKNLLRVPEYEKPMNTNRFLSRFKEICSSARFGHQRLHAIR